MGLEKQLQVPLAARPGVGSRVSGAALVIAGLAVCGTWYLGIPATFQILPTSSLIQFNTALGFALCGASLLATLGRLSLMARMLSAIVILAGILTIAQYVLGANFGIDNLVFVDTISDPASDPGRMAPNTAATFVLGGAALWVLGAPWRGWSSAVVTTLAALVLAMGAIALLGYAVDLSAAYAWGGFKQMALLTASLFIVLGVGITQAVYGFSGARRLQDLPWLATSLGVGLAALTALGWNALRSQSPEISAAWTALPHVLFILGLVLSAVLAGFVAQSRHLRLQAGRLETVNRELRRRSEEVHDLYNRAPCGYHSLDRNGTIVEINDTELNWLGHARDDVVGKLHADDLLTARSQGMLRERFPRFLQAGSIDDLELDFVRKDGSLMPALVSATALFGPDGEFVRSRSTVFDMTERRKAQSAQRLLVAVVESSLDAIISKTVDGIVTSWNRAAERLLGYAAQEMVGQSIERISLPELLAEEALIRERIRRAEPLVIHETRRRRKDGGTVEVSLAVSPILDDNGAVVGAATIVHDLSERKRMEAALRQGERQVEQVLESLQTAVVVHDAETRIRFVNPAAVSMLGLSRDQLMGRAGIDPDWHFVREDLAPMPVEEYPVSKVMGARAALNDYVIGIRSASGAAVRWILVNAVPVLTTEGAVHQVVVSFVDISERKRAAQELELQANIDPLTALSNRRNFMESAERELARCHRHRVDVSLLLLDVDHFKAINDEYGHLGGDLVLQRLAAMIRATLRPADICGRLGGEEFGVILPDTAEAGAVEFAERLRKTIAATSVTLPAQGALHFTVSIGVTSFDAGDGSVAAILDRADRAMYQAKRSGRNRVEVDKSSAAHH